MESSIRRDVKILTADEGRGTSIADFRVSSKPAEKNKNIFNYQGFIEDFIQVMSSTGNSGE
ncbi:hypothetical protein [Cytobacillus sp. FSL H8-0458]|uniref:hypothetical protein n=1 Tax=Cytobacillus sp. FSL H8-0458 TaxID=2975346 RepID=UPI0030F8F4AD